MQQPLGCISLRESAIRWPFVSVMGSRRAMILLSPLPVWDPTRHGPNPKGAEHISARQSIKDAFTEKLWDHYGISEFDRVFANEEDMDWGELKVSFHGSAVQYIARRNAWRRTASTSEANAASAPSAPQ
jgi:hypothetical protein